MSAHLSGRRPVRWGTAILGLTVVACADSSTFSGVDGSRLTPRASEVAAGRDPNSAAGDTKAFIGAWLDGEAVRLRSDHGAGERGGPQCDRDLPMQRGQTPAP